MKFAFLPTNIFQSATYGEASKTKSCTKLGKSTRNQTSYSAHSIQTRRSTPKYGLGLGGICFPAVYQYFRT
jgi:hypothetical protein